VQNRYFRDSGEAVKDWDRDIEGEVYTVSEGKLMFMLGSKRLAHC
jgi:hypothetical protein